MDLEDPDDGYCNYICGIYGMYLFYHYVYKSHFMLDPGVEATF
jgi:hypothetical protein